MIKPLCKVRPSVKPQLGALEIGEQVRLQDIRTKCWDTVGVVTGIRVADDGKILSYDIEVDGRETTRHRKYLSKIPNSNVETEEENTAGADQATE